MSSTFDRKSHWENIYRTKKLHEVSWYQSTPRTSLTFIDHFNVPKDASIIDIGGGDSFFVDNLIERGYTNVTVLDIAEGAVARAKIRLGNKEDLVKWIVADASDFHPTETYDFWHDRAAFHFLSDPDEIESYITTAKEAIRPGGIMLIGTFSDQGPIKCSGIEVHQYSEEAMTKRFSKDFEKLKCIQQDHQTPSNKLQNFIFCAFQRK